MRGKMHKRAGKCWRSSLIRSSMALQPFVGPWPLLQFRNHFSQTVGLLGRVISPSQDRYLHTGQRKHRINAHTDIHISSGIRTHDPSVRANEDSSRLRPRCHRDGRSRSSLLYNSSRSIERCSACILQAERSVINYKYFINFTRKIDDL
jgi:hypothetical protein